MHDPELDSEVSCCQLNVVTVMKATNDDKKRRNECQSIVTVSMGGCFASCESVEDVLAKIKQAQSDLPHA